MTIKIAVISTALPPGSSGQAVVLERLLRQRDARYWFFSDNPEAFIRTHGAQMGEYQRLRPVLFGISMREIPGPLGFINSHLGFLRPIWIRAREIFEGLVQAKPDIVIGCSGTPFDLPASALAAERLGARFIAYLFDDPVYQWPDNRRRALVRRLEPVWASRAARIICPNEVLADTVRKRTGKMTVLVRNPFDESLREAPRALEMRKLGHPVRILYGGAISDSQGDALADLVEVLRREKGRYELHVFTRQSEKEMAAHGLASPYVFRHDHISPSQIAKEQRAADILFLPLAFGTSIQEVLMSAAPGKLAEYLVSGRPILVHAPKGSFLSSFMEEHKAAMIVDTPSVDKLGEALKSLAGDVGLQSTLVENANKAAEAFTEKEARDAFWRLVAE